MLRYSMVMVMCTVMACGCERRRESRPLAASQDEPEYVIAVLVDLSGSFLDRMTVGGQAHDFMVSLLDRYFRDRIGTNDQIIIAQISGTPDQALLWQGSPSELRKKFPTPAAFSEFLRSKADPQGSCVHDAIVQTVSYMSGLPGVTTQQTKSAVFVLSDLVDNGPRRGAPRDRVIKVLRDYAQQGGAFYFYFVDQRQMPIWLSDLKQAGLECNVDSDIRRPRLPSFE